MADRMVGGSRPPITWRISGAVGVLQAPYGQTRSITDPDGRWLRSL